MRFTNATKTRLIPEMKHGWVSRGDARRETVKRDIEEAMEDAHAHIREFLPLAPTTAYKTLRRIPDVYPWNTVGRDIMFPMK